MVIVLWKPISYFFIFLARFEQKSVEFTAGFSSLGIHLHFFVARAPPRRTSVTAATSAPLEFLNFKNLFCFWCTLGFRIVYFFEPSLVVKDFLHLIFWYKATVVPESVFCEVFAAGVPDVVFIHPLLLFFPVFEHSVPPLLRGEARTLEAARAEATPRTTWGHRLVEGVGGNRAVTTYFP